MSRRLALAALAIAAVGLSGCISLFPKADPAQLYRFDAAVPERPQQAAPKIGVLRLTSGFVRAAGTDRILTVTPGGEAAYIAGTRWISPAAVLFDEQVSKAFSGAGRVRLIGRGEVSKAIYALKLDVVAFEVEYDQGSRAAPRINVGVRGSVTATQDRGLVDEKLFTSSVRADDNRIRAIVPAFNKALSEVLTEVVAWVDEVPAPKD